MLYDKISSDWMDARRNKDITRATILGDIMCDARLAAKNAKRSVTDDDTKKALTVQLKNIREAIKLMDSKLSADDKPELRQEFHIKESVLAEYEDAKLDCAETYDLVFSIFESGVTKLSDVMKALKNSGKNIDMRLANQIATDIQDNRR